MAKRKKFGEDIFPFKELTCCECGRIFVPAPEHIFNEKRSGKVYHICGYNCNCAFNRKHPVVKGGRWNSQ